MIFILNNEIFIKKERKKRLRSKNLTQNKFRSSRSDYSYRSTFSQSADTPIASFTWFIYQVEETNIRAQFPFTRVEEMEKSSRILLLLRDFNQSIEITSILQKRLKLFKRCIDWLIRDTCVTGYQVTREKRDSHARLMDTVSRKTWNLTRTRLFWPHRHFCIFKYSIPSWKAFASKKV